MVQFTDKKGHLALEILIALALFSLFITGTFILVGRYTDGFYTSKTEAEVAFIAQETFDAINFIAADDWNNLIVGNTFGLTTSTGQWTFVLEPDSLHSKYTRTISVASVARDGNCELTEAAGIVDPDTYFVVAQIDWEVANKAFSRTFEQYITRWNEPYHCIKKGLIRYLNIDISEAELDRTKKSLTDIELINEGDIPLSIDKMTVEWTKPGDITYIKVEEENVWHSSNGTGSPQGNQPSGTELDIVDIDLQPGQSKEINAFRFDSKVDGSIFHITVILEDGSATTSEIFIP